MGIFREAYSRVMAQVGLIDPAPPSSPAPAPAPAPAATPTRMREAAGVTVDVDDAQWRRLGQTPKDLDPIKRDRAFDAAQHAWEANPLARSMVELTLAYLLGKGVRLKSGDADAQTVLEDHWVDCINQWPIKLVKRIRELTIFGEQCWPVFVGSNGFVRVGYLDPKLIADVVMDPHNAEQPIGVVVKGKPGKLRKYRVIVNGPESVFHPRTQEIRATFTEGDCFYFRINDLCNGTRGRSDLLAMLDWLEAYDEFLFGEMERADFMRAFCWDVELTGANQDEVDRRAAKMSPPAPGSMRVHNESEKWNAVTPELQAADGNVAARLFRNHILGGMTIPEHWFGGAADVNRATGESMAEPTQKIFEMRQAFLGHALVEVATYVLRAHWGVLEDEALTPEQKAIVRGLGVEWPEMTTKDTSKYASAIGAVVSAVTTSIDAGLMTDETALAVIAVLAAQLGVDIDPVEELKKAREQLGDRGGDAPDLTGKGAPDPNDGVPTGDPADDVP